MDVILRGNKDTLSGKFPERGEQAPDFNLIDLNERAVTLKDYEGEVVLFSVFPDIDTGVCSLQTNTFNEQASKLENVKLVSVSTNTKEELENWCTGKQIKMDILRDPERTFGKAYGILLENANKLGRSVFVVNREGEVIYREVLENMSNEPDYDKASSVARQATAEFT